MGGAVERVVAVVAVVYALGGLLLNGRGGLCMIEEAEAVERAFAIVVASDGTLFTGPERPCVICWTGASEDVVAILRGL